MAALVLGADAELIILRSCNPVSRFRLRIFSVGTGLKVATTFCTPPATLAFAGSSARAGISRLFLPTRLAMLWKVEGSMFPSLWPLGAGTDDELKGRYRHYVEEAMDGAPIKASSLRARQAIAEMAPPFLEKTLLKFVDQLAHVLTGYADVARDDCADAFHAMAQAIGGADLVVLSSGCGYLNPGHSPDFDRRTVAVNIIGFMEMARAAFNTSKNAGRDIWRPSLLLPHCAAMPMAQAMPLLKAFQSVYLDGLRTSAQQKGLAITVTELQPGFVDTAMMKTSTPLHLSLPKTPAGHPSFVSIN